MLEKIYSLWGCVLMAKDYAKYSTKRSYKSKNHGILKILLGLFIAAILVSGCFYLKSGYKSKKIQWQISKQEKRSAKSDKIDKAVKVVIKADAVASTEEIDEPEFDFYTILPKDREIAETAVIDNKK